MRTLDDFGVAIERHLDSIERRFTKTSHGSLLLGSLLGLGVIATGIGAFVLVFAVLVRLFP